MYCSCTNPLIFFLISQSMFNIAKLLAIVLLVKTKKVPDDGLIIALPYIMTNNSW